MDADDAWRSVPISASNERGGEYILPIKIDDAELAGVAPTLGYLSIDNYPIDKIAAMLAEKLR